ncbi:hypothetical protein FRAAL4303 [Frankia alni ACN14a]|uniref:Uncharacterized protein n=1 Tax=Frankia alni (strain DSM 45986 / CECT 9034 / ACN14a) TaxID=326424 RepID=Q0RHS8_FRAAA|nr:hypothetical protein FRAAL4303 [Frankia alni ACN14a]
MLGIAARTERHTSVTQYGGHCYRPHGTLGDVTAPGKASRCVLSESACEMSVWAPPWRVDEWILRAWPKR